MHSNIWLQLQICIYLALYYINFRFIALQAINHILNILYSSYFPYFSLNINIKGCFYLNTLIPWGDRTLCKPHNVPKQSVCILGSDYNENSFLTVLFLWFCINQIEPNLPASGALRKPLTPAHILINVGTLQIWRWRQDALNMCVIKAVKQMAHCDFLFDGNGESRKTQPLKK